LNIKVSQCSVATRLMLDRIINKQFATESLLSLMVTELWKSVTNCRRCRQE